MSSKPQAKKHSGPSNANQTSASIPLKVPEPKSSSDEKPSIKFDESHSKETTLINKNENENIITVQGIPGNVTIYIKDDAFKLIKSHFKINPSITLNVNLCGTNELNPVFVPVKFSFKTRRQFDAFDIRKFCSQTFTDHLYMTDKKISLIQNDLSYDPQLSILHIFYDIGIPKPYTDSNQSSKQFMNELSNLKSISDSKDSIIDKLDNDISLKSKEIEQYQEKISTLERRIHRNSVHEESLSKRHDSFTTEIANLRDQLNSEITSDDTIFIYCSLIFNYLFDIRKDEMIKLKFLNFKQMSVKALSSSQVFENDTQTIWNVYNNQDDTYLGCFINSLLACHSHEEQEQILNMNHDQCSITEHCVLGFILQQRDSKEYDSLKSRILLEEYFSSILINKCFKSEASKLALSALLHMRFPNDESKLGSPLNLFRDTLKDLNSLSWIIKPNDDEDEE